MFMTLYTYTHTEHAHNMHITQIHMNFCWWRTNCRHALSWNGLRNVALHRCAVGKGVSRLRVYGRQLRTSELIANFRASEKPRRASSIEPPAGRRSLPAPPTNCSELKTEAACVGLKTPDTPRCAWSRASAICTSRVTQVDVVHGSAFGIANYTTAPWGTNYSCFRCPSAVQTPDKTVFIFLQAHGGSLYPSSCLPHVLNLRYTSHSCRGWVWWTSVGSCGDQAPKDITMKLSKDLGRYGPKLQVRTTPLPTIANRVLWPSADCGHTGLGAS